MLIDLMETVLGTRDDVLAREVLTAAQLRLNRPPSAPNRLAKLVDCNRECGNRAEAPRELIPREHLATSDCAIRSALWPIREHEPNRMIAIVSVYSLNLPSSAGYAGCFNLAELPHGKLSSHLLTSINEVSSNQPSRLRWRFRPTKV